MPAIEPIIFPSNQGAISTLSFRQLDELNGLDKGSSFKLFKRYRAQLYEGSDYYYLPAQTHSEWIATLKAAGQIYASTVHLVLFSQSGYAKLKKAILLNKAG